MKQSTYHITWDLALCTMLSSEAWQCSLPAVSTVFMCKQIQNRPNQTVSCCVLCVLWKLKWWTAYDLAWKISSVNSEWSLCCLLPPSTFCLFSIFLRTSTTFSFVLFPSDVLLWSPPLCLCPYISVSSFLIFGPSRQVPSLVTLCSVSAAPRSVRVERGSCCRGIWEMSTPSITSLPHRYSNINLVFLTYLNSI